MDATIDNLRPLDPPLNNSDVDLFRHRYGNADASSVQTEHLDAIQPLQRRCHELQRQLGELVLDTESEHMHRGNRLAEDAQDRQEQHHLSALRAILRDELWQIEHALERAAKGLYGICEHCDLPIPPRRLRIVPAATLCVPCQSRHEARSARH